MLRPRLPVALLLLSVLSLGCTEAGAPINTTTPMSNGSTATAVGINGIHTGEIWTANRSSGSKRFNLQTSVTTTVSEGMAYPTRDGGAFVEIFFDYEVAENPHCSLANEDIDLFNVKDTRTGSVLGSFKLNRSINSTVRLSPDARKIAMTVAEDSMDCGSNFRNKRFSVFSRNGEQLYRHFDETVVSFDWHPDGRLVIVNVSSLDANRYDLQIESAPGSHMFDTLLSWDRASDVTGYIGFRVGPTGADAVIEEVIESAASLSGVKWRDSRVRHFTLFEIANESAMFVHEDGNKPRVNAPAFSPDGQHILVTEGYSQGSVVFNATSLEIDSFDFNPALGTDELGTFSVLSTASQHMSYIVHVSQKLQPMPPRQYSANIRPVLANQGDGVVSTVLFEPLNTVTWTPVIN